MRRATRRNSEKGKAERIVNKKLVEIANQKTHSVKTSKNTRNSSANREKKEKQEQGTNSKMDRETSK